MRVSIDFKIFLFFLEGCILYLELFKEIYSLQKEECVFAAVDGEGSDKCQQISGTVAADCRLDTRRKSDVDKFLPFSYDGNSS